MKRFIISLICLTMAATLLPARTEAAVTVTRQTVMWSIPVAKQISTKVTLPLKMQ